MKKVQNPAKLNLGAHEKDKEFQLESSRREFLAGMTGTAVLAAVHGTNAVAQAPERAVNIARVAVPSSVVITSENKISALNDGFAPENSFDRSHGVYAVPDEHTVGGNRTMGAI